MSTTPRTDAAIVEVDVAFVALEGLSSSPEKYIEVDFARQLERELAETQSKLQEISITHGKWMADALQAGAEVNRLHSIIASASVQFFREGSDGETAFKMLNILNTAKELKQ